MNRGVWNQAIEVEINGALEGCYLQAIEKELDAIQLRSAAVISCNPIHSYMFSQAGQLLYATPHASQKIVSRGMAILAIIIVNFCASL